MTVCGFRAILTCILHKVEKTFMSLIIPFNNVNISKEGKPNLPLDACKPCRVFLGHFVEGISLSGDIWSIAFSLMFIF